MLFNSYIFIFLFLPFTLLVFYLIGGQGHHKIAISWLVATSLFFYGWWNPAYLGLILASIFFNYAIGVAIGNTNDRNLRIWLLIFGVLANISLIGYFKYADFFISNVNLTFGTEFNLKNIILPLAISFFTFQQIAYLVDAYKSETKEYNFLHFCLFVTFFPQLIAGPIVHHKDMLPQFGKNNVYKLNIETLAIGITIFSLGLFKKVILADNIALYASPVFDFSEQGITLTFFESWCGALAYTFQLYFDFSGYSEMAIGVALMFGIRLPLNFNSPYKSVNIIDFWRRWHMTLSTFLRDYLYIPLGGSRKGKPRRYLNLIITMLLGGLWHGAGWTFIAWGALHGFYLVINHGWHAFRLALRQDLKMSTLWGRTVAKLVTFIAIVIAWVFFRAESLDSAINILKSMMGFNGLSLPWEWQANLKGYDAWLVEYGISFDGAFYNNLVESWVIGCTLLLALFIISWFMPSTIEIMKKYNPVLQSDSNVTQNTNFNFTILWAVSIGFLLGVSVLALGQASEFLYFQF